MLYFEVDAHTLEDARPGLQLVEQLLQGENFVPYLYGLTNKQDLLLDAEDALAEDAEDGAAAPKLTEIAVAIQFSSDTLYYLAGSGLLLQNEEFAYKSGNDGVRTLGLRFGNGSNLRPRVHVGDFSVLALADSDMYLNDFLTQYGSATKVHEQVSRSPEPAVKASSVHRSLNPIDAFLSN